MTITINPNVIRFRISNSVSVLSRSLKFDRQMIEVAKSVLSDLQSYMRCQRELFLFATALYDMANAQGRLEIAEAHIGQLRQQQIQRANAYDELERMATARATDLCKQRAMETSAEYKHLEYRLRRLMECANAES